MRYSLALFSIAGLIILVALSPIISRSLTGYATNINLAGYPLATQDTDNYPLRDAIFKWSKRNPLLPIINHPRRMDSGIITEQRVYDLDIEYSLQETLTLVARETKGYVMTAILSDAPVASNLDATSAISFTYQGKPYAIVPYAFPGGDLVPTGRSFVHNSTTYHVLLTYVTTHQ